MPKFKQVSGNIIEEYALGFSKVQIVDIGYEYIYAVIPPILTEQEWEEVKAVMDRLAFVVKPEELLDPNRLEERLRKEGVSEKAIYVINSRVNGYRWLQPLVDDPNLEDIHCFKAETQIRVVHNKYGLLKTNIIPSEKDVDEMVKLLAYRGGSAVSLYRPVEDTVILPTGDRAALTYKSEVSPGSSFTIRKFPRDPWTPTKMILTKMIDAKALSFLSLCLDAKIPILTYGAMRTGKTSLINSLVALISPESSIGLVQDAPEMRVYHENVLYLYTSERVNFEELAKLALRKSVDYLIVNEVRVREEAYWWAQLVGTGHGGVTSIHADTADRVFGRLKDLGVEESLAEAVKILIHTQLFRARKNGKRVMVRRVEAIYFVEGLTDYRPVVTPVFEFDRVNDLLNEGSGLAKALGYVEDVLGYEIDHEFKQREEFLRYMSVLGIKKAEDFWTVYVKYRRHPEEAMKQLKAMVARRREFEMPTRYEIIAPLEEIKYCPRCGAELEPRIPACPKCGFRLILKRGVIGGLEGEGREGA